VELVGKVFGSGPQGELIVRAERPWRFGEGAKLCDRKGRALGRVEGIVGPAAAPYLVVRTFEKDDPRAMGARLKGSEVYMQEAAAEAAQQPRGRERRQGRPTGERPRRR
jgi:rRNA processing protein Gar1